MIHKMLNKFPCKECITLPICAALYKSEYDSLFNEYEKRTSSASKSMAIFHACKKLTSKCPLINKYYERSLDISYCIENVKRYFSYEKRKAALYGLLNIHYEIPDDLFETERLRFHKNMRQL